MEANLKWHRQAACSIRESLLVLASRAVDASCAVGGGAAPDALVCAWSVAVLARGRVNARGAVARRAAPFAVLLVVTVLVLPRWRMYASRAIARATAISAFRTHEVSFGCHELYHNPAHHVTRNMHDHHWARWGDTPMAHWGLIGSLGRHPFLASFFANFFAFFIAYPFSCLICPVLSRHAGRLLGSPRYSPPMRRKADLPYRPRGDMRRIELAPQPHYPPPHELLASVYLPLP